MNTCKNLLVATTGAVLVAALGAVETVQAITLQTTDFINNSERTNFNGFEGLPNVGNYGSVYTEDGITVEQVNGEQNDILTIYQSWGGEGANSWYPSSGDFGYTRITRQANSDFVNIGLLTGSGYSNNSPITYAYQLLNNGVSVFSGSLFDASSPNYLGFSEGGFDEVRLGAYSGNNPSQTLSGFQALAIDSIELSGNPQPVPFEFSPGLGILALGACGAISQLKSKMQKRKALKLASILKG